MKIAIATVQVPFITGGAEILVDLICLELNRRGYEAEVITIPFKWYPSQTLINCMLSGRMVDLTEVNGEKIDVLIAVKFPAYYIKHPNKIIWLMHQHRQAYDLWNTPYGDIHLWEDAAFIKNTIVANDNNFIREAKRIFTISTTTAARLKKYNAIDAHPLYHPPKDYEKLYCDSFQNFIFYPSRIDKMKRQRLLVQAARFLRSDTKIFIAGKGSADERDFLESLILKYRLQDRVRILGFITDKEKIEYYAKCLGVYFGAYDEDYGYVTLEAFFSKKPVIIHRDAGGPLEFVEHERNGFVIDPNPAQLAAAIDSWAFDKVNAQRMGNEGYQSLIRLGINWDTVVSSLLGETNLSSVTSR